MNELTKRCESYLLSRKRSKLESVDLLVLSQRFGMESLRKQCIETAKDLSQSQLKSHKMYGEISLENQKELAEKRWEYVECSRILKIKQLVDRLPSPLISKRFEQLTVGFGPGPFIYFGVVSPPKFVLFL